jgi:hypothetical protein
MLLVQVYGLARRKCPSISRSQVREKEIVFFLKNDYFFVFSIVENGPGFPDDSNRVVIFHGGCDENVHFAHTSALCKRLNALNKMYSLNLYPADRFSVCFVLFCFFSYKNNKGTVFRDFILLS